MGGTEVEAGIVSAGGTTVGGADCGADFGEVVADGLPGLAAGFALGTATVCGGSARGVSSFGAGLILTIPVDPSETSSGRVNSTPSRVPGSTTASFPFASHAPNTPAAAPIPVPRSTPPVIIPIAAPEPAPPPINTML